MERQWLHSYFQQKAAVEQPFAAAFGENRALVRYVIPSD